jgi:long-subunit acyl-CoA synthetase (AMP-forming)
VHRGCRLADSSARKYRDNPEATALEFDDGWLRTGDVLQMNRDGFLWFQDRKKEMLKYKGEAITV